MKISSLLIKSWKIRGMWSLHWKYASTYQSQTKIRLYSFVRGTQAKLKAVFILESSQIVGITGNTVARNEKIIIPITMDTFS